MSHDPLSKELLSKAPMSEESVSREPLSEEPKFPTAPKGLLSEFWDFIIHEKIWWMTPIIVVLLAMVAFILFAEASPIIPFIYAL